ncbi:MAG: SctK family type III secretion system sorting platform protein [Bradyrhizobium sp.]
MPSPLLVERNASDPLPEFRRTPAIYIHPERLHSCLPYLPAALTERMLTVARLHPRLSEIIISHYGLVECSACDRGSSDCGAAAWPVDRLTRLAHRAGAVWHAGALRSLILGRSLAPLLAAFDEDLRAVAIRHIDLAAEATPRIDMGDVAEAIRRDGMHCLNAWVTELRPCSRERVILKFPLKSAIGGPVSPTHHARGVLIIRRLLAETDAAPPAGMRQ